MTEAIEEQVKNKNRKKLIQQNIKLNAQLFKLEKEIEMLDEQKVQKIEDPSLEKLKMEIQAQKREMRQLKQLIDSGRQSNAKQNSIYIKKQEDGLTFLKKQLQNLQLEKDLIFQGHQDKIKKLSSYQPLQKHKQQLQTEWIQTKKENKQTHLKLVEMERKIRKLHSIKQRAKSKNNNMSNQQSDLTMMQAEIMRMNLDIKDKELKWKPNIQYLDKEFFTSRDNLVVMNRKLEELEKEEGIWRMRAAALRDHEEIAMDRERLGKIGSLSKVEPPPVKKIQVPSKTLQRPRSYIQPGMYRQIKDKKKNDKYVDLVKIQPSQSPVKAGLKQSSQIKKAKQASKNIKKEVSSSFAKIKINEQSPKQIKKSPDQFIQKSKSNKIIALLQSSKDSQKQSSIKKDNEKIKIIQSNKNSNNWINRREKQKIKNDNQIINLAEQIKNKAEEVKKMNKNMERYEERERSVSSPKKIRQKSPKIRIQTYTPVEDKKIQKSKSKQKVKIEISPLKQSSKIELIPKKISTKQSKQQGNNIKIKPRENEQSSKNKEKTLSESIDLKSKNEKNQKQKILNKIQAIKTVETPIITKTPKQRPAQLIAKPNLQPKSPKNTQKKPIFQIVMNDPPKIMIPRSPNFIIDILKKQTDEDQTQGVPKIIKRKRAIEGGQSTTGTST